LCKLRKNNCPRSKSVPLAVLQDGTGGSGADIMGAFWPVAAEGGFAIVAPDSRKLPNGMLTWEVGDHPDDSCVRSGQSFQ